MTQWFGCYDDSWKGVITPAAFAHPAKFSKSLVEKILIHMENQGWIQKGDTIADPFAGVACGGIMATYRGFRWVGVELEEKFFSLGRENLKLHQNRWSRMGAPTPELIRADSRRFDAAVDAVVTSPPYVSGGHHTDVMDGGNRNGRGMAGEWNGYGKTEGQVGTLKIGDVDAVVSSPPYETINTGAGGLNSKPAQKPGQQTGRRANVSQTIPDLRYGKTEGQIARVKGETYWEAMKQVYEACYRALKPSGVMAIVVKDYVKDNQRVRLCDDTMRLLVHIGFEELERVAAMLVQEYAHEDLFTGTVTTRKERKSFWRRLSEGKGAPRIDYEEVLFVRKSAL